MCMSICTFAHRCLNDLRCTLQFKEASSGSDEAVGSAEDSNSIVTQLQEFKRIIIQSQPAQSQMHAGCTALVALKCGNMLYVANAGDSRGVLCRAGTVLNDRLRVRVPGWILVCLDVLTSLYTFFHLFL